MRQYVWVGGRVGVRACSVTHDAKHTRRIILPSVTSLASAHFATLSHKRYDLKKVIQYKFVGFFSTNYI
jgi:hypothetical protein